MRPQVSKALHSMAQADSCQGWHKKSCQFCQDLHIWCATGKGTPVRHKRTREGNKDGGPSKRTKREQGVERTLGMEFRGLLEVLESNWLLHQLWQSVDGFHSEVCGLV